MTLECVLFYAGWKRMKNHHYLLCLVKTLSVNFGIRDEIYCVLIKVFCVFAGFQTIVKNLRYAYHGICVKLRYGIFTTRELEVIWASKRLWKKLEIPIIIGLGCVKLFTTMYLRVMCVKKGKIRHGKRDHV